MALFYPNILDSSAEGKRFSFATSKVVCVGRNYAAHAAELSNPVPTEPLLFIKSTNTLVDLSETLTIPKGLGECHHELEIAILIGRELSNANQQESLSAIYGIGIALDLTLRDLQQELKEKKHPWEKAKSFDGACPISGFIPSIEFSDLNNALKNIHFSLSKNGKIAQCGNSKNMLFAVVELIQTISQYFSLYPGDIILTGTPEGVAPIVTGDNLVVELDNQIIAGATVI